MEMKITLKNEEPLLNRQRIEGNISFEASTPSNAELKKKLASSNGCDEKLVAIRRIKTAFGDTKANFVAYIYKDEASLKSAEIPKKEKKQSQAAEEKK